MSSPVAAGAPSRRDITQALLAGIAAMIVAPTIYGERVVLVDGWVLLESDDGPPQRA